MFTNVLSHYSKGPTKLLKGKKLTYTYTDTHTHAGGGEH
jgi:hypothetical protein